MQHVWQHIRLAIRVLCKNRTFSIVTIGTLALGIGAAFAIFSLLDAALFRNGSYDESGLVLISGIPGSTGDLAPLSFPNFEYLEKRSRSFSAMAAFADEAFTLTGRGEPLQLEAARVSWNFLPLLGVQPSLGRTFLPEEDQPGGANVVIINHSLWTERFAGSPAAIGQSIKLDDRPYTIIGVLPAGFGFPFLGPSVDVWTPRLFDINIGTRAWVAAGAGFVNVVARLQPNVSITHAQAEASSLYSSFRSEYPGRPDSNPQNRFDVADFREQATSNFRPALLALFSAVSVLLLIACGNIASLMLARFLGRRQEIAIRLALGARRSGIIHAMLTESTLLGLAGGSLGLGWACIALPAVATLIAKEAPTFTSMQVNWHVLLFALSVSLICGILFGIFPVVRLSQPLSTASALIIRGGIKDSAAMRPSRLLVIFEVTLSVVLVVSASLLIRSFVRLRSVPLGFDPAKTLTMRATLSRSKYSSPQQIVTFYNKALESLRSIPDVQHAGISSALPLTPARLSPMLLEGQPVRPLGERPILNLQMVSPDYPAVFAIPVLRGRVFTEHDDASSARVALVNDRLARDYWPGEDPIGKRIWIGRLRTPALVVGVLANTRNASLAVPAQPEVFVPFPQLPWAFLNLSLRVRHNPSNILPAARHGLALIDRDQPITDVQTGSQIIGSATGRSRVTALLVAIFSAVALVFATIGIYGVLAYSVEQRSREIGIRMALGASEGAVLRQVSAEGVRLTLIGLALGLAASFPVTRLIRNLLYSTGAHDPLSFAFAALLFLTVGVLASYIPARRATKLDPAATLRTE
ncbi:MAG TPA: ABC transporter permease [Bryobacteraceae bacterium]|nr:ABC transporter permease [Bryobacteraceae bacterium]